MADTATTTTSNAQWDLLKPYLTGFLNNAQAQYNNGQWTGYQGDTVVPFSSQTQQALNTVEGTASQGNPLNDKAMGAAYGLLDGTQWDRLYDQAGNDAFGGVLDTQAGKLTDDINRGFSASGRYGSAAQSGTIADQVGDFRAKATSDNWNQNIANQANILNSKGQQQLGAAALTPTLYDQQYAPADRLASVGSQYENLAGNYLQQDLSRYNANNPRTNLQNYGGLLGMGSTGQGSTTQSISTPTNYAQQVAGYAGAGSAAYGLLSNLFGSGASSAADWTGGATGLLF